MAVVGQIRAGARRVSVLRLQVRNRRQLRKDPVSVAESDSIPGTIWPTLACSLRRTYETSDGRARLGSKPNPEPSGSATQVIRNLLALALVLGHPLAEESQGFGWWVTWSFRPMLSVVEGLPVGDLDPNWRLAMLIRPNDLPIASTKPGERLEDTGLRLSVDADLDGDGHAERAVVGVFETIQGEFGRFLLILGRSDPGDPWQKRAVFQVRGGNTFSAVAVKDTILTWYGCLECDDQCEVVHAGTELRLRCWGL